jgi:hypothetical protein
MSASAWRCRCRPEIDAWHFAKDPLQVIPLRPCARGRGKIGFVQALEHPLIGIHQGGALDRALHERAEAL